MNGLKTCKPYNKSFDFHAVVPFRMAFNSDSTNLKAVQPGAPAQGLDMMLALGHGLHRRGQVKKSRRLEPRLSVHNTTPGHA